MQTGVGLHEGIVHAFSILGIFTFQWVPALVLSLNAGAGPVINTSSLSPLNTPVTLAQAGDYLQSVSVPTTYQQFLADWGIFAAFSMFISLIFLSIMIYCVVRIRQIRRFENMRFNASAQSVAARDVSKTQLRWNRITEEIHTTSEQSWRLAILEADIMLNELLDTLGYKGETMADKMRLVEKGDFNSIDIAWEAHRARNKIAHEGSSMSITHREAQRIVDMYERIFREFKYIT